MGRVAVLMGGRSAEREVSLRTGEAIAAALTRCGEDVVRIDAGADLAADLRQSQADRAFIALHGRWGEDGTVQGLLEVMGIPYTGSGILASALAMDKALAKTLFRAAGLPTPDFSVLAPGDAPDATGLGLPVVVKPVGEGSTIGVSVVREQGALGAAVTEARSHGSRVLLERFVPGRELTVGILDGADLPIVEVIPEKGFYDYESKYTPGRTRYECPAVLAEAERDAVARAGRAAYHCLGCRGAARTDLILDETGRGWVLEVNTIPGMTPTSLLPKAAAAAGMSFDDLVGRMLAGARLQA